MTEVAPMKTAELKPRKMEWITEELREGRKRSMELQQKYRNTREEEDGKRWKEQRRGVAKELRRAKNNYAKRGLQDKEAHSKSMWQGVKAHLGWEDTGAPTRLVKRTREEEGGNTSVRTITDPKEIGEEITKAFEEKAKKVKEALGPMTGNYLEQVQDMHEGNVGRFAIGEITEKDVAKRLQGGRDQLQGPKTPGKLGNKTHDEDIPEIGRTRRIPKQMEVVKDKTAVEGGGGQKGGGKVLQTSGTAVGDGETFGRNSSGKNGWVLR